MLSVLTDLAREDGQLWGHKGRQGEVDVRHGELLIELTLVKVRDNLDDLLVEVGVNIELDV